MLEGIALTIVLIYICGHIAIKAGEALFDRPMTPQKRQQVIQEQMSKLARESSLD